MANEVADENNCALVPRSGSTAGGEHVRFAEHRQARWCHQGRNVRRGWGFFVAWIGVQKTRKTRCTELFEVGEGEKQVGLGRPL